MSRFSPATAMICSCVWLFAAATSHAADKVTIIFPSVLELPSSGAYQVAKFRGYYDAANLDVEFIAGHGGVDAATQVGAGNADFAAALGDTSMIVRSRGVPVRGVALMGGNGLMILTTREQDGIKGPEDLRGKAISTVGYQDSTYFALLATLASVKIKSGDADIQALGPTGVVQSFIHGDVKACACIPDHMVLAEDAGLKLKYLPSSNYVPVLGQALVTSDRDIKERPDVVRRFVQATLKAYVELRDHPVETAKIYVQAVPAHKGKEAQLARVYTYYAKYVWSNQPVAGQFDRDRVAKVQDSYHDLGIIKNKSPVDDLFSNQFVPAAK